MCYPPLRCGKKLLKKYIFDTLVTLMLLNGVEVRGCSIPKSTWNNDYACEEPKLNINHALYIIINHLNV